MMRLMTPLAPSRPPRSTECTTTAGSRPSAPNPIAERNGNGPSMPNFGSTYAGSAQRFQSRPRIDVSSRSGSKADAAPGVRRARITIASSIA